MKPKRQRKKNVTYTLRPSTIDLVTEKAEKHGLSKNELVDNFLNFVFALDPEIMTLVMRAYDELKRLHGFEVPYNVVLENLLLTRIVAETAYLEVFDRPSPTANIEFKLRPRTVNGKKVLAILQGVELLEALQREYRAYYQGRKEAQELIRNMVKRRLEHDPEWKGAKKLEKYLEQLEG